MDVREQYARFVLPVVALGVEPIVVASAKGRTLTAQDGRTYLDCFSGISVVNAGHNHPRILAAAREQMEKLVHCCSYLYHVPAVGQLAEKLAEITPGDLTKSFFCNSGAEANEGAMRLAKQATGRREFVALAHSFHGRTVGTLSVTRKLGPQKEQRTVPARRRLRAGAVLLSLPARLELSLLRSGLRRRSLTETIDLNTSGDVAAFVGGAGYGRGGHHHAAARIL